MKSTSARRSTTISIPEEVDVLSGLASSTWALAGLASLLAVIGLVTIRSASTELAINHFPRQIAWVLLGFVAMAIALLIDYRALVRFAVPAYIVGVLMLIGVLLFGHEAGGARSWVGLFGFGMQPSEIMKLATALLLVHYMTGAEQDTLRDREVLVATLLVLVPFGLIAIEPDLGGAMVLFPLLAAVLWVAGIRARTLMGAVVIVVVMAAALWQFGFQDYQRDRITTFLTPGADPLGAGWQARQSKIAVGSGEIVGRGFMQGTQSQLRFLPARHTDFIFAVLAEERGFLGVLLVLGLYLLYFYNAVRVACRARDRHGLLLVVAILSILSFHVLYNSAMMIGLVPITGIPLPFLSYGGSFTLFCFFATGLILSVDARRFVNR